MEVIVNILVAGTIVCLGSATYDIIFILPRALLFHGKRTGHLGRPLRGTHSRSSGESRARVLSTLEVNNEGMGKLMTLLPYL